MMFGAQLFIGPKLSWVDAGIDRQEILLSASAEIIERNPSEQDTITIVLFALVKPGG